MFILDDIVKGIGKRSAGKEAKRAGEEEAAGQFKSDTSAFNNQEAGRQSRAQALLNGLGSLFGGKYAGLVDKNKIMAPRENTAFKHSVVDPSKGVMWDAAGNAINSAGNLGMSALSGSSLLKGLMGQGGAAPTSLATAPGFSAGAPIGGLDTKKIFG